MCLFNWIAPQPAGAVREPPKCEKQFVLPRLNSYGAVTQAAGSGQYAAKRVPVLDCRLQEVVNAVSGLKTAKLDV